MAKLNLRIGTKLGMTAGIGVLLVAGMLANEMLGNQSIAKSSGMVIINFQNRGNAQTAGIALARAEIAAMEIGGARSVEQIDKGLESFRGQLVEETIEIYTARQRASGQVTKDAYGELKKSV